MSLNPVIEKFYLSSLDYAGIQVKDNIFVNKSESLGEISIDGKFLTLPYFENLKNPSGKVIFHLLNENYTNPENIVFNLYRKRLILELNIRLSSLIISLISIAADVQLQQKIKSGKLIKLISNIGEVDHTLIEAFLATVKASRKVNNEAFIFDIFLKKNGEIKDTPYAAIGKINFHMYNEVVKSLEDKEREYRVFNHKLRKKDLLAFETLFNVIFPNIDQKEIYTEGTDNKIFRYLNILLKTGYLISARMNELADILEELNEPSLNLEDIRSNHDWSDLLENLYDMPQEIRLIPNQTDVSIEPSKLKTDESKAKVEYQPPASAAPTFDPSRAQTTQQPIQQPIQQPMQAPTQPVPPRQLTPEEIIRGSIAGSQFPQPGTGVQPGFYQPTLIPQPGFYPQPINQPLIQGGPGYAPAWVQQEMARTNQPPMQQPNMMMQQPMMMQPAVYQQPMMMQPGVYPQGQYPQQYPIPQQQQMQYPMPQQSSLQVNPHFITRNQAPWN